MSKKHKPREYYPLSLRNTKIIPVIYTSHALILHNNIVLTKWGCMAMNEK
jgi:hypothetical protein